MSATDTVSGSTRPLSPAAKRLRRLGGWLGILVCMSVLALILTEARRVLLGDNVHEVVRGAIYRGAQPTSADMEELVRHYRIHTIVNLRGTCDSADWFSEEARASQRLQLCQEDVCLSSGRLPSDPELRHLIDILDNADYPLFFHCRRGADRTGLAVALYVLLKTDGSLDDARQQLGWRYGHVAIGRTALMDRFIEIYASWLAERKAEHSPERFRHWLVHEYRSAGYGYEVEQFTRTTGPLRTGQPTGFHVRLRNTGTITWPLRPIGTAGYKLKFSLRDKQDEEVHSGYAGLFEGLVAPGQAIDFTIVIPPVKQPGLYSFQLDMVDDAFVCFYQMGSEPLEEELVFHE